VAIVKAQIETAPEFFKTVAMDESVDPVVNTSSTMPRERHRGSGECDSPPLHTRHWFGKSKLLNGFPNDFRAEKFVKKAIVYDRN